MDILESCGRTVMTENLTGRAFLDLGKLEHVLCSYDGIDQAQAYVAWSAQHRPILCADISGKQAPDMDKLNAYLAENCEEVLVPKQINFTEIL